MNKDNTKYVGIDIRDKTSLICVIDSEGDTHSNHTKSVGVRIQAKNADEYSA